MIKSRCLSCNTELISTSKVQFCGCPKRCHRKQPGGRQCGCHARQIKHKSDIDGGCSSGKQQRDPGFFGSVGVQWHHWDCSRNSAMSIAGHLAHCCVHVRAGKHGRGAFGDRGTNFNDVVCGNMYCGSKQKNQSGALKRGCSRVCASVWEYFE